MQNKITIAPPPNFASFSPSELFRFFFQIGRWTEESFSDEFQSYTHGKIISTVTINNWKNKDVIPKRYSGQLLKMVETKVESQIAQDWVQAFETVWALHLAIKGTETPLEDKTSFSNSILRQHQKWIYQLYSGTASKYTFSKSEIYIPLELRDVKNKNHSPFSSEILPKYLSGDLSDQDKKNWILISGGPGAGKSMTALHLATSFENTDICSIYLRGNRLSNIDIDITDVKKPIVDSFSPKSFLKHFRASSYHKACLVLDGLNEIGGITQNAEFMMTRLLSDLLSEQAACAAHGKLLSIVAFGRDAHILHAARQLSSGCVQHYSLMPLDGCNRTISSDGERIMGRDLRPDWWRAYLTATKRILDPSLPDFLATQYDDLWEFASDPLLSFIICETALEDNYDGSSKQLPHEQVNHMTYSSNKNDIYKAIILRMAKSASHHLDAEPVIIVLKHLAVAAWHNEKNGSVSIQEAFNRIEDKNIQSYFKALNLSDTATQTPPEILITTFYYQVVQATETSKRGIIQFTHKTFAEYLVCTELFDSFTHLISSYHDKDEFEAAIKSWGELSCVGFRTTSLADFCQKEAASRYDSIDMDWDVALIIIQEHIGNTAHQTSGLEAITIIQQASSMLFFIWSCLNSERQKRTQTSYLLSSEPHGFGVHHLKMIHGRNELDLKTELLLEPVLLDSTFLTFCLSGLKVEAGDMSQLSFSAGHIEHLLCERSNFAMSYWNHVKLSESNFAYSAFQHVKFRHWRVLKTVFNHCMFQGSSFQGGHFVDTHLNTTFFSQCHFSDIEFISCTFTKVIFDRCIFSECAFQNTKDESRTIDMEFRNCTFINMDKESFLSELGSDSKNSISLSGELGEFI